LTSICSDGPVSRWTRSICVHARYDHGDERSSQTCRKSARDRTGETHFQRAVPLLGRRAKRPRQQALDVRHASAVIRQDTKAATHSSGRPRRRALSSASTSASRSPPHQIRSRPWIRNAGTPNAPSSWKRCVLARNESDPSETANAESSSAMTSRRPTLRAMRSRIERCEILRLSILSGQLWSAGDVRTHQ